jgi:hypothetical protein
MKYAKKVVKNPADKSESLSACNSLSDTEISKTGHRTLNKVATLLVQVNGKYF